MKKRLLAIIAMLLLATVLCGCAAPGATASFKDYTGNAPNGTLGTIKYIMDRPGYKGVQVSLTVTGFGDVAGVKNQDDVQDVTVALIKGASLQNSVDGFEGSQYYYYYNSESFRKGQVCTATLFYLVPPESANEDLHFVFQCDNAEINYDTPCGIFKEEES
ncbi:MAG: hypothetical protein VB099_10910 [Candidatus Limiplasma sp.]|nr:hypothetical protein [Candidatus Limiplasma sp.]